MERIFTNLQIEWLANIKLLSEYEDDCFSKEERSEKFAAFVETEYPGEELALNEKLVHMANKKDVLDYIEQTSTIVANLSGLIPNVGNLCQGAIPFVKELKKLVPHK